MATIITITTSTRVKWQLKWLYKSTFSGVTFKKLTHQRVNQDSHGDVWLKIWRVMDEAIKCGLKTKISPVKTELSLLKDLRVDVSVVFIRKRFQKVYTNNRENIR